MREAVCVASAPGRSGLPMLSYCGSSAPQSASWGGLSALE